MRLPFSQGWNLSRLAALLGAGLFSLALLHDQLFTPTSAFGASSSQKVLLRDVRTLTLRQGKKTTFRRTYAVPQLKCVGGRAHGKFEPQAVQCYNTGFDGIDVQWECKAELPDNLKFGEVEVFCEGYDHKDDPYILKGSCGLEYTLEYRSNSEARHWNNAGQDYINQWKTSMKRQSRADMFFTLLSLAFFGFIVYSILQSCITQYRRPGRNTEPPPPYHPTDPNSRGGYGGGGGGGPSFGGGPAGGGGGSGGGNGGYKSSSSDSGSFQPGFWSGVGLGGLASYLATSAANNRQQRAQDYYRYDQYGSYGAGPSTGLGHGYGSANRGWGASSSKSSDSSSNSSTMRTSTGYGGTRRR